MFKRYAFALSIITAAGCAKATVRTEGDVSREGADAATDGSVDTDSSRVGADAATDARADSDSSVGVYGDAGCGEECLNSCTGDGEERLASLLWGQGCSVTIRLDYATYEVLGYQVLCGEYARVNADAARTVAEADTTFGQDAEAMSNSPSDYYVFYEPTYFFSGGVSVVNSDIGRTVFGGSMYAEATGSINFPDWWRWTWVGAGCEPSGLNAYPHEGLELFSGGALRSDDVNAALAVVDRTGVPRAFGVSSMAIFSTLVLLYPRSSDPFLPEHAEWIVIVNGGLRE